MSRRVCSTKSLCLILACLVFMVILLKLKSSDQMNLPFSIDYRSINKKYSERKSFVNNYCHENEDFIPEQSFLNPTYKYKYFYLKSKNIYLHYCQIGKIGGGTWRRNLDQLMADEGETMAKAKRYLPHRDFKIEHEQTLNFVFVRNPFSRLASAYYDKMFRNWSNPLEADSWPTRKEILMKYRRLSEQEALANTNVVSEQEFATFIIDNNEFALGGNKPDYSLIDAHWRPQTALCPFCSNKYHIIGQMETFSQDENFILQALGKQASNIVHFF